MSSGSSTVAHKHLGLCFRIFTLEIKLPCRFKKDNCQRVLGFDFLGVQNLKETFCFFVFFSHSKDSSCLSQA